MSPSWQPSGAWKEKFRKALDNAFSAPALDLLVSDYFSPKSFFKISPPGPAIDYEYQLYQLIDHARMEGWLLDLVAAAHERRPRNADITQIAEDLGLTIAGPRLDNPTGRPFEAIIRENAQFINLAGFIQKAAILAGQVCWVDIPGGGGTGFLIAPDLVLTNYHVIKRVKQGHSRWQDVRCRFDYKQAIDGSDLGLKKLPEVGLNRMQWLVHYLEPSRHDEDPAMGDAGPGELDYALLRLAEKTGEAPVGGDTADPEARTQPRGWIDLREVAPPLAAGNQVFLLQHPWKDPRERPPRPDPLSLSVGTVLGFNGRGTRVRYDASTRLGSSGCPCFNADLQLVALHHAHDTAYPPKWNQAVPLAAIREFWSTHSIVVA